MRTFWHRLGSLPFFLVGAALLALGLLALNHIVNNYWPVDVARLDLIRGSALGTADAPSLLEARNGEILVAFLASVMVAITGLVLPLVYYLNRRFQPAGAAPRFLTVLRQSLWIGLWVAFCAWLQMNRTFGVAVALLVAFVLFLFELLLQVRHRAERSSEAA
jgi:hypothetical protein